MVEISLNVYYFNSMGGRTRLLIPENLQLSTAFDIIERHQSNPRLIEINLIVKPLSLAPTQE